MTSTPFTIHNLPYGIVSTEENPRPYQAIAYKNYAIDVGILETHGVFDDIPGFKAGVLNKSTWNAFAALPSHTRLTFRQRLTSYLESTTPDLRNHTIFTPLTQCTTHLPMHPQNYSDFYCSHEHAANCSAIFGFDIAQGWYHLPQVYNGRTSSLAVSGTPITRPCGVFPVNKGDAPTFQAEGKLDFEMEMGVWICGGVPRGQRLDINKAKECIFGFTLLNDWSARQIQFFEMAPLGPFHSKGSLTSVSAWIVPVEALEGVAACARHYEQEPAPLGHLKWRGDGDRATWDVHVEARLVRGGKEYVVSRSNLNELHWTPLQMVTHLASAGEGLSAGDVFGTGTISSSRTNERGEKIGLSCLWERQLEDARMESLPGDLHETLLKDGDEVVMSAWCEDGNGEVVFGFGECRGVVLPAVELQGHEK
ncbi:hypothetical protein PMZ80_007499 [Knufia obscura]|uniref:Fumarylacetoacetase n=2 Tax=Knufia TaxID=430999 RepID=A0AAN8EM74_9EURO|nr:hypothetical protein PMZ80_007499 [Knufia obscura]KAK5954042.1 hypothetical protein OHC33_004613 [Knufia fluminis]